MLQRLIAAHELTLARIRNGIEETEDGDDEGTNETHVWYIAEHTIDTPVVEGAHSA